ncbi:MAG: YCF48-related protein [Candidatus Kapabacteria bacterium]|nr:YCF48-related protein [Candidatus Kapabacteria bacterium]
MKKLIFSMIMFLLSSLTGIAGWVGLSTGTTADITGQYYNGNTGYACASAGMIIKTTNGLTWSTLSTNVWNNLNSVYFFNYSLGLAVGERGKTLMTNDGGSSWTLVDQFGPTNDLYSISFSPNISSVGVSVGDRGLIKTTRDGGFGWDIVYNFSPSTNDDFFCCVAAGSYVGYAVGANGKIYKTTAIGTNSIPWTIQNSGTTRNLHSAYFWDENNGMVVGDNGTILKTTNGGSSWNTKNQLTAENLLSVHFANSNVGFISGTNGTILKSNDAGETWFSVVSGVNAHLRSIYSVSSGVIYTAGTGGVILKSTDGGDTPAISTNVFSGTYCSGTTINISFIVSGAYFNNGNKFIAQLSDQNGSFTNPRNLDSIYGTSSSSINVVIPYNIQSGSRYRIRVISSLPAINGSDNGQDLSIFTNITSSISGSQTVCENQIITYSINQPINGANNLWSQTGGTTLSSATSTNFIVQWSNVSRGNLTLTQSLGSCQSSSSNTIIINPIPKGIISYTSNTVCGFNSYVYSTQAQSNITNTWTVNAGTIIGSNNGNNVQVLWSNLSSGTLTLTQLNTVTGCSSSTFVSFTILSSPNPIISNITDICQNTQVTYATTLNANSTYQWTINGGTLLTSTASNSISVVWSNSGIGTVSVVESFTNGCSNINSATFAIFPVLRPSITPNAAICNESSATYTSPLHTGSVYNWSVTGGNFISVSENQCVINWTNEGNGLVNLIENNSYGCQTTTSNTIQVNPIPATFSISSEYLSAFPGMVYKYSTNLATSANVKWLLTGGSILGSDATSSIKVRWNSPGVSTIQCIQSYPNTGCRRANSANYIVSSASQTITLTSPNGGENWYQGENHNISYNIYPSGSTIDLNFYYSSDNGNSWNLINKTGAIHSTGSAGQYNWVLPNTPTLIAKIRITNAANEALYGESQNSFVINALTINDYSSQKYLVNTKQTVKWSSIGVDFIRIEFSSDNGNSWNILSKSTSATIGSFEWTTPRIVAENCFYKITDISRSQIFDLSGPFSIKGLLLLSPVNGNKFQVGSTQNIVWDCGNDISNVKLEFTLNDKDYTSIVNYTGSSKTFSWIIPKISSSTCKVKISNQDDLTQSDISSGYFSIYGNGMLLVSPKGGENIANNSNYSVSWASSGVKKVNIDFALNGRSINPTWNTIVKDIDASLGSYSWSVSIPSNQSSSECLLRIYDNENTYISAVSANFFKISDRGFSVPSDWSDLTKNTGSNSTIIVPFNINPKIGSRNMQTGDAVGVFYQNNGKSYCAGYSVFTSGSNMGITVWGDNEKTTNKDGFATGESYMIKVWDALNGKEMNASIKFDAKSSSTFSADDISVLTMLKTYDSLLIPLKANEWTYISSNVKPFDLRMESIFSIIKSNVGIIKNDSGLIYIPAVNEYINTIKNWRMTSGYQIYMNNDDTLYIEGDLVNPKLPEFYITMQALRWHILPVLCASPNKLSDILASISSTLIMAKNSAGKIYYPAYNIEQTGMISPGEGFKAISSSSTGFYSPTTINQKDDKKNIIMDQTSNNSDIFSETIRYKTDLNTGYNATMLISSNNFKDGDEIAVWDKRSKLIGCGLVSDHKSVLTVWGDNPLTNKVIEAAALGEDIRLSYWNKSNGKDYNLISNKIIDEITRQNVQRLTYNNDEIYSIQAEIGTVSEINDGSENSENMLNIEPNPSFSDISFKYNLKSAANVKLIICNSIGSELLNLDLGMLNQGQHCFVPDISGFTSDVYFVKLITNRETIFKQFVIIK